MSGVRTPPANPTERCVGTRIRKLNPRHTRHYIWADVSRTRRRYHFHEESKYRKNHAWSKSSRDRLPEQTINYRQISGRPLCFRYVTKSCSCSTEGSTYENQAYMRLPLQPTSTRDSRSEASPPFHLGPDACDSKRLFDPATYKDTRYSSCDRLL